MQELESLGLPAARLSLREVTNQSWVLCLTGRSLKRSALGPVTGTVDINKPLDVALIETSMPVTICGRMVRQGEFDDEYYTHVQQ